MLLPLKNVDCFAAPKTILFFERSTIETGTDNWTGGWPNRGMFVLPDDSVHLRGHAARSARRESAEESEQSHLRA